MKGERGGSLLARRGLRAVAGELGRGGGGGEGGCGVCLLLMVVIVAAASWSKSCNVVSGMAALAPCLPLERGPLGRWALSVGCVGTDGCV